MSTPLRAVMIGHIVQIILQRIAHRIQLKLFFDLSEHVENRREVVPARRDSGQVFLNELLKVFGEGATGSTSKSIFAMCLSSSATCTRFQASCSA